MDPWRTPQITFCTIVDLPYTWIDCVWSCKYERIHCKMTSLKLNVVFRCCRSMRSSKAVVRLSSDRGVILPLAIVSIMSENTLRMTVSVDWPACMQINRLEASYQCRWWVWNWISSPTPGIKNGRSETSGSWTVAFHPGRSSTVMEIVQLSATCRSRGLYVVQGYRLLLSVTISLVA